MSANNERDERLAQAGRLLDSYGAELDRWPPSARGHIDRALNDSPDMTCSLIAEARALASVLDRAPAARTDVGRLADRILAAALADENSSAGAGPVKVVELPVGRRHQAAVPPIALTRRWRSVAALMAACLVAGIILGGSFRVDPVLLDVADAVGLHADLPGMSVALADDSGDEGPL